MWSVAAHPRSSFLIDVNGQREADEWHLRPQPERLPTIQPRGYDKNVRSEHMPAHAKVPPVSESTANVEKARLVVITGLPGSGKTSLAVRLAASMDAVRMCPDDWMKVSGIDLWDAEVRSRIEQLQLDLTLELLARGRDVIIEWGVWTRQERDHLRDAAREVGAAVELRYVTAPIDELWRRIVQRDVEGRWGSRSITRAELEEWWRIYEPPTDGEIATYDQGS